jgi:hypothetical protein
MPDKKPDAGQKRQQTVITKEQWEAQQLAAHLLGEDGDDPAHLPTAPNSEPSKMTTLNPFNIPCGPIIDAQPKPKPRRG